MTTVRRGTQADLDDLLVLVEEYCVADDHPFDESTVRRALGPLLVDETYGVVWVVEHSGTPAGYAVVTWSWSLESGGRDALLDEIYIAEPGRGIGSALMNKILEHCRARGLPRIFLETEQPNVDARRFYGRHGFRSEDSIWMVADL